MREEERDLRKTMVVNPEGVALVAHEWIWTVHGHGAQGQWHSQKAQPLVAKGTLVHQPLGFL